MPRVRPLTPLEARWTLVNRLGRRIDRARQFTTKYGLRPYRVFLTWTKFSGDETGEGNEQVYQRIEILPTPKLIDLTAINYSPVSSGVLPIGSIQLRRVSISYTQDTLMGKTVPIPHQPPPEPFQFFYEVVEDGRGDDPSDRQRYRLAASPFRAAGSNEWRLTLERASGDMRRDGTSNYNTGEED
jgi:hypothetical protein